MIVRRRVRTGTHCLNCERFIGETDQHYDRHFWCLSVGPAERSQPLTVRQPQIQQDHVNPAFGQALQPGRESASRPPRSPNYSVLLLHDLLRSFTAVLLGSLMLIHACIRDAHQLLNGTRAFRIVACHAET